VESEVAVDRVADHIVGGGGAMAGSNPVHRCLVGRGWHFLHMTIWVLKCYGIIGNDVLRSITVCIEILRRDDSAGSRSPLVVIVTLVGIL
jgi:hypothetical protein